jgi:hypothetical protein
LTAAELQEQIWRREETREKIEAELAALPKREREAVGVALRQDPTRSPFGKMGTEAMRLRNKDEQLRRQHRNIVVELEGLRRLAEEADAREAAEERAEIRKQIALHHDRERGLLAQAGDLFSQLLDTYNGLVSVAEERDELDGRARSPQLWNELSDQEREKWVEFSAPRLSPFPMSLERFLVDLSEGMLDPSNRGYRAEAEAAIKDERGEVVSPELKPARIGRSSEQALINMTPDRRGDVCVPQLSGRVEKSG